MASIPLPEGLTETDYEAIEEAVTETVRGRWFLSEFARRNRVGEMRQVLDAISRLEATVASNQTLLPSVDPSVRLLVQRIKEVAGHLDTLAGGMREAGVDDAFVEAVGVQARAVAGMMRAGSLPITKSTPPAPVEPPKVWPRMPRAELPAALGSSPVRAPLDVAPPSAASAAPVAVDPPSSVPSAFPPAEKASETDPDTAPVEDPRLATLSGLDRLTLDEKLALFT